MNPKRSKLTKDEVSSVLKAYHRISNNDCLDFLTKYKKILDIEAVKSLINLPPLQDDLFFICIRSVRPRSSGRGCKRSNC